MKLERIIVVRGRVTSISFHRMMRRYRPHLLVLKDAEIEAIRPAIVPYQVSELSITNCNGSFESLYSCFAMKAIRELVLDEASARILVLHGRALCLNVRKVDVIDCVFGEDLEKAVGMMKGMRRLCLFKCKLRSDNLHWLRHLNRLECLLLTSSATQSGSPLKLSGLRDLVRLDTLDIADVDVVEGELEALRTSSTVEILR